MHLYMLPMTIIKKIDAILASFLWSSTGDHKKIHLVHQVTLIKVVDSGKWGILDTLSFNRALICKSLWRGLTGRGIWSLIIRGKYMAYKDIEDWIKYGDIITPSSSYIWWCMMRIRHWLFTGLYWEVGNGNRTIVGLDIIKDLMGSHTLFSPLLQHLHDRGMFLFSHVVSHRVSYPHIQSW